MDHLLGTGPGRSVFPERALASVPFAGAEPATIGRDRGANKTILRVGLPAREVDRPVSFLKNYCLTMISGSALSGTRRHCALSSASKRQTSPFADISSNSPRSSRHTVGAKAVTAGSQRGLRKTAKLSGVPSVLVRASTARPLPRTGHPVAVKGVTAGSRRGVTKTARLTGVASVLVRARPHLARPSARSIAGWPAACSSGLATERAVA